MTGFTALISNHNPCYPQRKYEKILVEFHAPARFMWILIEKIADFNYTRPDCENFFENLQACSTLRTLEPYSAFPHIQLVDSIRAYINSQ